MAISRNIALQLFRNATLPNPNITTAKAKEDLQTLLSDESIKNGEPIIYAYIDSEDNSKRVLLGIKYGVNHYQIFDGNEASDKIKELKGNIKTINGETILGAGDIKTIGVKSTETSVETPLDDDNDKYYVYGETFNLTKDISANNGAKIYKANVATGEFSHAEGYQTKSTGFSSHAENRFTTASGLASHAEGSGVVASGSYSHAEGYKNNSTEYASHAEGYKTVASNKAAHSEGRESAASGMVSHAEGWGTTANGDMSHAEGRRTMALGITSHAEGQRTISSGAVSHAEGAQAQNIYLKGGANATEYQIVTGMYFNETQKNPQHTYDFLSHSAVNCVKFYDDSASAKVVRFELRNDNSEMWVILDKTLNATEAIDDTNMSGNANKGIFLEARGDASHTEGEGASTVGACAHAEGGGAAAYGSESHAEGHITIAKGLYSHAENTCTMASGDYSHAEGDSTTAHGTASHAEGGGTTASGNYSHAEGTSSNIIPEDIDLTNNDAIKAAWVTKKFSLAKGQASHVSGIDCLALGNYSSALGLGTITSNETEVAMGQYNKTREGLLYSFGVGDGVKTEWSDGRNNMIEITKVITKSTMEGGEDHISYEISMLPNKITIGGDIHMQSAVYSYDIIPAYESTAESGWFNIGYQNKRYNAGYIDNIHAKTLDLGWLKTDKVSHIWAPVTYDASNNPVYHDIYINYMSECYDEATGNPLSHVCIGRKNILSHLFSVAGSMYANSIETPSLNITDNFTATNITVTDGLTVENLRSSSAAIVQLESTALGKDVTASGVYSFATGRGSVANNAHAVATGFYTEAFAMNAFATGSFSQAHRDNTFASGDHVQSLHLNEASFGRFNKSNENQIFSIGIGEAGTSVTPAVRKNALEIYNNGSVYIKGVGDYDGQNTANKKSLQEVIASAVGKKTETNGEIFNDYTYNKASGPHSHAEGRGVTASGLFSHAEGSSTTASDIGSHAEGDSTTASGQASHAEGYETMASGPHSHAEGDSTTASGDFSHAEGVATTAENYAQHTQGFDNVPCGQLANASSPYLHMPSFVVGNGSVNGKHDSLRLLNNGNLYLQGIGGFEGGEDYPTFTTAIEVGTKTIKSLQEVITNMAQEIQSLKDQISKLQPQV